jgi:pseudouridylate synthase I
VNAAEASGDGDVTDAAGVPVFTRFRLDVAYDGGAFSGWATQPGLRTVQGEIEGALATIFRRHPPAPRLVVAGRTDAGVHALGQVAHVDLSAEQLRALRRARRGVASEASGTALVEGDGALLARRLNGIQGPHPDLVISRAACAAEGFDARFSALWRRYQYRVADSAAGRDPLQRHRTTWHPAALNVQAMDAAAGALVGLHDFASYCKPREGATTIRTLQEFRWRRDDDGVLIARLQADAFCHSMVRALVGACVAVGEGNLTVKDLVLMRDAAERTDAFKVMPARGLTLMEVGYPSDAELAVRAEQTRARRSLPEARFDGAARVP